MCVRCVMVIGQGVGVCLCDDCELDGVCVGALSAGVFEIWDGLRANIGRAVHFSYDKGGVLGREQDWEKRAHLGGKLRTSKFRVLNGYSRLAHHI